MASAEEEPTGGVVSTNDNDNDNDNDNNNDNEEEYKPSLESSDSEDDALPGAINYDVDAPSKDTDKGIVESIGNGKGRTRGISVASSNSNDCEEDAGAKLEDEVENEINNESKRDFGDSGDEDEDDEKENNFPKRFSKQVLQSNGGSQFGKEKQKEIDQILKGLPPQEIAKISDLFRNITNMGSFDPVKMIMTLLLAKPMVNNSMSNSSHQLDDVNSGNSVIARSSSNSSYSPDIMKQRSGDMDDKKKQYHYDVTLMVSAPILGHTRRDVIPVLAVHEEEEALRRALQKSRQNVLRFEKITATLGGLRSHVTLGTKIIHFCGRGIPRSLIFEKDDKLGIAQVVPVDALQTMTAAGGDDGLMLVFLSACHSENAAKSFESVADHVIAVNRDESLHDEMAVSFTEQFYTHLVQGRSVRKSFNRAIDDLVKEMLQKKPNSTEKKCRRTLSTKFSLLPENKQNNDDDDDTIIFGKHDNNNNNNSNNNLLMNSSSSNSMNSIDKEKQNGEHYPYRIHNDGTWTGGYVDCTKHISLKIFSHPPKNYVGHTRLKLLHNVLDRVLNNEVTVIQGKKWAGKSALVNKVCHYLWERNTKDICGIFVFDCYKMILNSPKKPLAYLISRHLRKEGKAKELIPENYMKTGPLINRLSQSDKKFVLVFEDIDQYNFNSFLPNQRLDIFLSNIVESCQNCHVIVTISSAVNRLDLLVTTAASCAVPLNHHTLHGLDPKLECKEFISSLTIGNPSQTLTAQELSQINLDELCQKCGNVPGLIKYGLKLYEHNRKYLKDENIVKKIENAIENKKQEFSKITPYKWAKIVGQLTQFEIENVIKDSNNRDLWQKMFGMKARGNPETFIKELFNIYKRILGEQAKSRRIENYEREFISHELIPYLCNSLKRQIKYIPYNSNYNNDEKKQNEMTEDHKVPIEVFESVIRYWSQLVDVITNEKIQKYYLYGSACYQIRKNRKYKGKGKGKDLLPPKNGKHDASSNGRKESEFVENHYRFIIGLITTDRAKKIVKRYPSGTALIRFSRSTPGGFVIVVGRSSKQEPLSYRIKTQIDAQTRLFFTFDGTTNRGKAGSLHDLIDQIPNIHYVYTHKNRHPEKEKIIDRESILNWIRDSDSNMLPTSLD